MPGRHDDTFRARRAAADATGRRRRRVDRRRRPDLVQSMTNTDTADVGATVAQVRELAEAGSELVRVTVNTAEAAAAVPAIRERLDALKIENGRADVTTMTGPTLENALKTADADKIEVVEDFEQPVIDGESIRGYGAAAFRIGDDEIREAYNEELQKMKESGELLEIISEFGFTENEIPHGVTTAELCEE